MIGSEETKNRRNQKRTKDLRRASARALKGPRSEEGDIHEGEREGVDLINLAAPEQSKLVNIYLSV